MAVGMNILQLPSILALLLAIYIAHLIPVCLFGLPIYWIGRKRVQWVLTDTLGYIIPICLWGICTYFYHPDKAFQNVSEVYVIGLSEAVGLILRVIIGKHANQHTVARITLYLSCIVAILMWRLAPNLDNHY